MVERRTFRKRPVVVSAWRSVTETTLDNVVGSLCCDAGDWIVTGIRGEVYPCKPDVFADTFDPLPDAAGAFRKRQVVVGAVRVAEATVVQTLEGPARAGRGDWVVTDTRGERWPVKADVSAELYEDAPG